MKIDAVLKSINAALMCVKSAQYFAGHDMDDSVKEKCGEAIGYLESTKLYLEIESGSSGKDDKPTIQ